MFACLLVGAVLTLLMTPKFMAHATMEIQRESENFTLVEGAQAQQSSGPADLEFYETQYGLLQAQSLAERVATDLGLANNRVFFDMFGSSKAQSWFDGESVISNASTREQRIEEAAHILLDHFAVSAERQSRLVTISFTSPDPQLSQRVANAWTKHFIQSTLSRRFEATSYARNFLEQRLNELREQINDSERRLVTYAERQGIVNLPGSGNEEGRTIVAERPLVADQLATASRQLAIATSQRIEAESRLGSKLSAAEEALENQAMSELRARRAELASEYSGLMVQFDPEYPPAQALQQQIDQFDKAVALEEQRVGQSITDQYQSSIDRENRLQRRVDALQQKLMEFRRKSIQYNIFQREVDTNRQLYDALLQRYKEIGVAGGVGVNNISVVDPALLPDEPSSPKLVLNLLASLLLGGLLGAAAAFALEQVDQGIEEPSEVESLVGLPLLGSVPKVINADPIDELENRHSMLSEAYVSLQTNLAFTTDHGIPRTIAVTSSRSGEGKTTTSTSLAVSIARIGRRVLLIDADMRSPSLHGLMGVENTRGLANYLSGNDEPDQLIRETRFKNLSLMTSGPIPPSTPELLSSARFPTAIKTLLNTFDHIVFDAPPVMGLADAPLIASEVESVLFVIEANNTKVSSARAAIGRLAGAKARLLGAILTKFDQKRAFYDYAYEYGYGFKEREDDVQERELT